MINLSSLRIVKIGEDKVVAGPSAAGALRAERLIITSSDYGDKGKYQGLKWHLNNNSVTFLFPNNSDTAHEILIDNTLAIASKLLTCSTSIHESYNIHSQRMMKTLRQVAVEEDAETLALKLQVLALFPLAEGELLAKLAQSYWLGANEDRVLYNPGIFVGVTTNSILTFKAKLIDLLALASDSESIKSREKLPSELITRALSRETEQALEQNVDYRRRLRKANHLLKATDVRNWVETLSRSDVIRLLALEFGPEFTVKHLKKLLSASKLVKPLVNLPSPLGGASGQRKLSSKLVIEAALAAYVEDVEALASPNFTNYNLCLFNHISSLNFSRSPELILLRTLFQQEGLFTTLDSYGLFIKKRCSKELFISYVLDYDEDSRPPIDIFFILERIDV